MELWKDIKGYEGLYQISNKGRVKSLIFKNRMTTIKREKILKNQRTNSYYHIILRKDGITKNYLIHRLVAEAFVENSYNYKEINHKDENILNNDANNLEWCDHSYNINYGNRKQKVKEKLQVSISQYDLGGKFVKEWPCMNDAIRYYNNKHIFDVCKGERKKASGYFWRYTCEIEK